MVEKGLYELLTQDSNITALIGTGVYWILAPKGAVVPYAVLSRVSTGGVYDMAGSTGFREAIFQVDCFATDFLSSRAMSTTIRNYMEMFCGNLPDTDATYVAGVHTEKDWDMPYEEGGKGFVYRALLQFRIWYYDTAP